MAQGLIVARGIGRASWDRLKLRRCIGPDLGAGVPRHGISKVTGRRIAQIPEPRFPVLAELSNARHHAARSELTRAHDQQREDGAAGEN